MSENKVGDETQQTSIRLLSTFFDSQRGWLDSWAAKYSWAKACLTNNSKVVCVICSQFTADGKDFLLDVKADTLEKHEFGQPGARQWTKEQAAAGAG
jgi:hypothetical protein